MGTDTYLTLEEENQVKTWILRKAKLGFPLAREDVKDSIQRVLQQCPRPTPFVNQRPGNKWMSLYLKRYPEIDIKNSETILKARAVVTRESIESWFRDLKELLKQKNCEDIFQDGKRVLNCDETGCLTCPKAGKILGPKGYKNLYEISCGKEKDSITVICTYNANGDALPPMVVFPYKRTPYVIMKSLPPGWSLGKSDSGWMVSSVSYEYVSKVLFQYFQDSKVTFSVILFLDGHKSHLSLQLSNFCAENQIIIYCLPPNATHIVQPCDGIPDDLCRGTGCAASWAGPNKVGVYAYKHVNVYSEDTPSNFAPCDTKVHFLSPEVILFTPVLRKLVNESNGVFLSVQKLKSSTSGDNKLELLKHSKRYRSILRACVESLQDLREKSLLAERTLYENFLTIFYQVECVWHLTEILYVDVIPGDVVLPRLLEWVRFHFPSRELRAIKILAEKSVGADLENSNYWEVVVGCALHGKLDVVRALLALHSKGDRPAFIAAENALRSMPVYNVYGGYSVSEFTLRWKQWQMDLSTNIESKTFSVEPNLEALMKLAVGSELWEFSDYTDAWYELLAAKLFYSNPCCKQPELARHANDIAVKWQASRHLDNVILALMEGDLHQVIKGIQYMNDNGWFAAHLTDLLFRCGRLKIIDNNQKNVTPQLHESLILEYGSLLMGHHSLWQCGASYLEHCPLQGLSRLEALLQSISLGTEAKINKMIDLARDRKMHKVVTSICKSQSMKCIRRGRYGNALAWALKAQDGAFATYIADKFLKYYADHGEIQCQDMLENLGSCMLVSDRLTFLGKYCEFHQTYAIGEFKEATGLLISLLVSNLTPKYFWSTLLTDAIPLLEAEDVIFSAADSFELLRCVEEHGYDPKFQNKIEIFRLAVARNLSRALNLEGCQGD